MHGGRELIPVSCSSATTENCVQERRFPDVHGSSHDNLHKSLENPATQNTVPLIHLRDTIKLWNRSNRRSGGEGLGVLGVREGVHHFFRPGRGDHRRRKQTPVTERPRSAFPISFVRDDHQRSKWLQTKRKLSAQARTRHPMTIMHPRQPRTILRSPNHTHRRTNSRTALLRHLHQRL
jgi:hypothetical protein